MIKKQSIRFLVYYPRTYNAFQFKIKQLTIAPTIPNNALEAPTDIAFKDNKQAEKMLPPIPAPK